MYVPTSIGDLGPIVCTIEYVFTCQATCSIFSSGPFTQIFSHLHQIFWPSISLSTKFLFGPLPIYVLTLHQRFWPTIPTTQRGRKGPGPCCCCFFVCCLLITIMTMVNLSAHWWDNQEAQVSPAHWGRKKTPSQKVRTGSLSKYKII